MPELVVAPILEPAKNRMETQLRVPFELAENRDVTRIADFFRQVDRVENEFGLEEGVFL